MTRSALASAAARLRDIELAVEADEQRIAIALVDTVIRDLFDVGITLYGALPQVQGPAERTVQTAIDDIDRVIRTIREVVFALKPSTGSEA